jgi:hypothetical protein
MKHEPENLLELADQRKQNEVRKEIFLQTSVIFIGVGKEEISGQIHHLIQPLIAELRNFSDGQTQSYTPLSPLPERSTDEGSA